jgi:PHD/YefM family antitoxin component YafN of YafNO toxin-antitoxin module
MIELHPSVLERNGEKAFVVLPYEEFVELREALDTLQDLQDLRDAKAREGGSATVSLKEGKTLLGL